MSTQALEHSARLALAHYQAGRLREAESVYRQVHARQPGHPGALHMLGVIAHRMGRSAEGAEWIRRAVQADPSAPEYHNNLGVILEAMGELAAAEAAYRQALAISPRYAQAYFNLGNVLGKQGQPHAAIDAYRQAIALQPNAADAHFNLAKALAEVGRHNEAIESFRHALALRPEWPEALLSLGNAHKLQGELDDAIAAYRQAIALRPNYAEAHNNLGSAMHDQLGLDEAIAAYRQALALRPDYAEAHGNLGVAAKDSGDLDEAIAAFRRSIAIRPDPQVDGSLLYTLHFHPEYDAGRIFEEHVRWNHAYARPLSAWARPHENEPDPERRLRVGYVSPDFRNHPVGRFLLPLLDHHDHARFDIVCYSDVRRPDDITDRVRPRADIWRQTQDFSHAALAELIRRDRIDLLIDLTMHMSGTRLLTFARKPAPVQVTYLAYCSTTGLATIDYRLSDPYLDPPGGDEGCYAERTVRLPRTYWCYEAPAGAPDPGPLSALAAGHVTFGCFNNFCKVTPTTISMWCGILRKLPESRFVLHSHEGAHRRRVVEQLEREGVAPSRLEFVGPKPPGEYFRQYQQIDVALDPFPYGGGTTTCDALWMGVPVVSMAGRTAVSRAGLSILSNVGLADLVARTPEQYQRIATELAGNRERLAELRASLRGRMTGASLMDAPAFAQDVESAYRQMWRDWCTAGRKFDQRFESSA